MNNIYSAWHQGVREHAARKQQLVPIGNGTHWGILPEIQQQKATLSPFQDILLYSPEELVISVQSGVKVLKINALLAEKQQRLCATPRNLSGLFGEHSLQQTIGGALSLGFSGSDRLNHYAMRDMLLGNSLLTGRGELIKAGGRVFKNVTGYDWGKLIIGAQGSLGMITDIQLRLMPLPTSEVTLVCLVLQNEPLMRLLQQVLNSSLDVSGAAARQYRPDGQTTELWRVYLRLQGTQETLNERQEQLVALCRKNCQQIDLMKKEQSNFWWKQQNDLRMFDADANCPDVWLFTQPASKAMSLSWHLLLTDPHATLVWDWGGTQVWCATQQSWQVNRLQSDIKPYASRLRPVRVADQRQRYLPTPDPVQHKIIQQLYHQFDPQSVFSWLMPYTLIS